MFLSSDSIIFIIKISTELNALVFYSRFLIQLRFSLKSSFSFPYSFFSYIADVQWLYKNVKNS
ncbi:MAG: hypothetical protein EAX86_06670 [Candidatus Heimdallarchaeota archaeon]|nr:hypothetical protein [Candidatus Heimdallarchaeota archaeon]